MPHRIVSLIASATEIVCALGFESELEGRSHECDYPPGVARLPTCFTSKVRVEASCRAIDGQVLEIVHDGLSVYSFDFGQLDGLRVRHRTRRPRDAGPYRPPGMATPVSRAHRPGGDHGR